MNAFKHSFFIGNQGVDVYGHPISLFTILQFCRALEDTSSIMGSPIYTHSLITCISLMNYIIVIPLRTLFPNHSLIEQCIREIYFFMHFSKDFNHPRLLEVHTSIMQVFFVNKKGWDLLYCFNQNTKKELFGMPVVPPK
jgi:hypothetical protein